MSGAMLARVLPFGLYIAFLMVEDGVSAVFPGVDPRWLYPIKATAVALALAWFWSRYVELKVALPRGRDLGLGVVAGVLVFVLWINLESSWMLVSAPGEGYIPLDDAGNLMIGLVVIRIVGAALIVPLMEELFWRSFLQRWIQQQDFLALDPAQTGMRALFMVSVVFAVAHNQWLAGLIAGLVYGWLYIRTGSLWVPILAHAVTNGLLGVYVVMSGNWRFW